MIKWHARLTRNWLEKPSTRVNMQAPPADFLKRLNYDTCVYEPRLLELLVEIVGEDRVVLGSDYPVGDRTPVELVMGTNLSAEAKEKITWRNAERLLGS